MQWDRNLGQRSQAQIWSASAARPEALGLIRQSEEQPLLALDCLGLDLREDRDFSSAVWPTGRWHEAANLNPGVIILERPRPRSTARTCGGAAARYQHPPSEEAIRLERLPNANQGRLIRPHRHGSTGGYARHFFTFKWSHGKRSESW